MHRKYKQMSHQGQSADTKRHIQIPASLIRELQARPVVRLQFWLGEAK